MNLKNFKKVHDDEHKAVFRNDKGHEITMAKKALTKQHLSELQKLPLHASDGADTAKPTPVQWGPTPTPDQVTTNSAPQEAFPYTDDNSSQPQSAPTQTPAPASAPSADRALSQGYEPDDYSVPDQPTPLTPQGPSTGDSGVDSTMYPNANELDQEKQRVSDERNKEDAALIQDHADGKINYNEDDGTGKIVPKTYRDLFEKKDTLGKIGTIFGLMLSGAGSGLAHQPNALLGLMNKEIDNDLEAQKANQSTKLSYYKAHAQNALAMAQAGEIEQKAEQTGVTTDQERYKLSRMTGISAHYGGKNGSIIGAMQHLQDLTNKMPAGQRPAAQALHDQVNQMAGAEMAQNNQKAASQIIDTEAQFKRRQADLIQDEKWGIGAPGQAKFESERHFANIPEQASGEISPKDKEAMGHLSNLDSSYVRAQQYLAEAGPLSVKGQLPTGFRKRGEALQNQIELEIGSLEGLGRFTPEEAKRYKGMIPDLTGTHFTDQDAQAVGSLRDQVEDHRNNMLKNNGIKGVMYKHGSMYQAGKTGWHKIQ